MILYRYEGGPSTGGEVYLHTFRVVKKTPAGQWVEYYYECEGVITGSKLTNIIGKPRWMSSHANHPYACEAKDAALHSFIARKKRQIAILDNFLETAKDTLIYAKEMQMKEKTDDDNMG